MPNLICRCAMKAKKDGYKYFGLQFYGMLFYSLQICIYKYFINISSTGSFVVEY